MDLKGVFISILYFSKLSIQSLGLMVKAIYERRRAKSTFRKTLVLQGISPEAAQELAEAYPNPINEILNLTNMHAPNGRYT